MPRYFCPHCRGTITYAKRFVSDGYFGACLRCDEDFYKIELIKGEKNA